MTKNIVKNAHNTCKCLSDRTRFEAFPSATFFSTTDCVGLLLSRSPGRIRIKMTNIFFEFDNEKIGCTLIFIKLSSINLYLPGLTALKRYVQHTWNKNFISLF